MKKGEKIEANIITVTQSVLEEVDKSEGTVTNDTFPPHGAKSMKSLSQMVTRLTIYQRMSTMNLMMIIPYHDKIQTRRVNH